MKKQLLFFNYLLRKGMIAFALLFFTLAVKTEVMASSDIDPPGRMVSNVKAVPVAPTVVTSAATNVGAVKATLGGDVTNDGGDPVTWRGIVWSTFADPEINVDPAVSTGTGTGSFSGIATGVPPNTTIHFRAFATNSFGTSYGADLTFTTNAALSATTGQSNVSCFGGSNGTASVTASGGAASYTYSWSPSGGTGATASGLTAGVYDCTITDAEGTVITKNVTITQPSAPVSGTTVVTNVACFGGNNATINLTPTGGTGPYTFNWGGGITTEDRTALAAGSYSVTITDANGCTGTVPVSVTQPLAVAGTTLVTNVACFGGTNGSIDLTPTGGTPGYTYNWGGGITSQDRISLAAGTYSVTITDANGCTGTVTVSVTQPSAPVSGTTVVTNVACNGGNTGAINLTPTGGTGPYTFNWGGGITTEDRVLLLAGSYSVTITDANGCTGTVPVSVTQPSAISTATGSQTNVSCFGGTNGSASVSPSGGAPGYTYSWSPSGGTAATATGLAAGSYTVTITDANGCTATRNYTLTQPSAISTATGSQTNVSCFGGTNGSASVSPSGGTPGYTYSWSPSGGTAATATGLAAGSYTVTITDANGCTATRNYTLTQPSAISTATGSQTNVSCFGGTNGSASVSPSGGTPGYTYSWSPSGGTAATATGLAAGSYTVTITDANGCTATRNYTLTQPSAISTATGSQTNVSCFGGTNGSASVSPSGGTPGYTYSWSPSGGTAATATGLAAGSYTVTITDANGCTATRNYTLTQPSAISTATGSQTNVSCFGGTNGSASVTPSGGTPGYTYSWSPSGGTAATATGLAAGSYTVTITDANGCTATRNYTLTQPSAISTATGSQTNVSCFGGTNGSASVSPSGGTPGYTYSWSPSGGTAATATGLAAGSYTVTITDANGCTATRNYTLTQPSAISTATGSQTNVSCFGGTNGSASVTPSGGAPGYTYSWSPSGGTAATATGLAAGSYTVTITDANGCTATRNYTLTQPSAISTATGSQTNVSCFGGTNGAASVSPSGGTLGYTYSWSPSGGTAATATGLAAGSYTVTITDANGCTATRNYTLTQPSAISTATGSQTNVSCFGGTNGSASVSPSGGTPGYTYSWSPSGGTAATATGLAAGSYTVTITDANGCTATRNYTLTQPSAINTATGSQTNVSCFGGTNGSASVTPSGGTPGYTYSWSPSGGTAATATGLAAGSYTVTITDANGCTATRNYSITQPSAISTATGSQTNVSCNGGTNGSASVSPSGGTPGYTYSWSPSGGTAATATGLAAGSYTVTITDANGCTATRNYSITQPSPLVVSPAQVNVTTAGGSNGSATVTVTGGTPGYTYSWLPSGGTAATASGLTAGAYTCTITDANGCTATKTFNIIQPVVLTGFPDINKAYGATTFTLTNPVSASAGAFSYTSSNNSIAAISGQNVTIIKPGTVTITATQAANGNYDTSSITATLNIAAKDISLTLNPAPSINKTYDGNDNATLASGNYQLIGLEGTDEVLVSFTAKYENKNAGTGKTVTVSNIALSGAQKDYYHLTTITATVTGSITPKPLTATATTVTKVYDGTDAAIVAFNPYNAVSGLLTGDNVSTGYASAVYSNKNVAANKPITINGLNLTGTDKNNYSLNAFSTTGSITPKPLTITADNKEKFAGTANPTLTASYTAFAANEDNSVLTTQPVITTLANVNSPIGTYDINVSGAASANYSIDYVKGILTIKPGAPSSITLAGVTLFENKTAGTNAGTLSSTSDDPSATFTYSLVAGTGDTDNALFAISANKINTAASLNFENKASYSIRVKCITQHGLSLEKTFTIALSDVNEIPTLATVANQSICYTKTAQTVALSGISAGHETAQTTTLTVSSSNANLFENLTVTGSGATANVNYKAKTGASGTATITVTVKDNGGVADGGVDTYSSTFVITINALPIVAINSDKGPQVSKGEAVILNATGGASYAWTAHSSILSSLNSASLTVRPSETTTYTVTATNASGCTETQTFTITVLDDLVKVKATNIMSPNGDGVNDNWVIENLDMYPNNEVRIFTRAGRLVYSKKGYDNSWDATLNGAPLAEGTYYYIVDFGPNKTKVKGFITITRPN